MLPLRGGDVEAARAASQRQHVVVVALTFGLVVLLGAAGWYGTDYINSLPAIIPADVRYESVGEMASSESNEDIIMRLSKEVGGIAESSPLRDKISKLRKFTAKGEKEKFNRLHQKMRREMFKGTNVFKKERTKEQIEHTKPTSLSDHMRKASKKRLKLINEGLRESQSNNGAHAHSGSVKPGRRGHASSADSDDDADDDDDDDDHGIATRNENGKSIKGGFENTGDNGDDDNGDDENDDDDDTFEEET